MKLKQLLILATIVLSLLGLLDAGYLTYEKLSGGLPPCGAGFDCGEVLSSEFSHIGPIPVSALGMMYYMTVLVIASTWLLEIKPPLSITWQYQLLVLSSIGLGVSMLLVAIMAWVLESWCFYCLISAAISTLLFILHSMFNILEQTQHSRKAA